jgi:hypothetical protein
MLETLKYYTLFKFMRSSRMIYRTCIFYRMY